MKLVIVESPSKAKTINKYLGSDYKVVASYGHIRKLISKSGSVDPNHDFEMHWEETSQSKKHLKIITDNIKKSDSLYLATDPDREGEAISWHIINYLKDKKLLKPTLEIHRVVFNSITKREIIKAFDEPRTLDSNLVSAYLARTALDYLVGFGISPILWRKLPGSRSAGRVQSVALKLICERENEIESFIPEEYWKVITNLKDDNQNLLTARLFKINNLTMDKMSIKNQEHAQEIKNNILKSTFILSNIEYKTTSRNPFAPFTTSTLQQDAFNKLGFSAKRTMQIAQKLYEGIKVNQETVGLITYMRTDATQINPAFISEIRSYIETTYTKPYLSASERIYKTKAKNAQEAHEAIRPTDILKTPESIANFLDNDMLKLYSLIWKRTVASQMESAKYNICTFTIPNENSSIILKSSGSVLTFEGFYKVYNVNKVESEDGESSTDLPDIKEGTKLSPNTVEDTQHFTEPPARFSEASLVKSLEEMGIGRPSTYASTISVLQERNYTKIEQKRFIPEARGRILTIFLTNYFKKYVEYNFTASLEEQLDIISNGKETWIRMLSEFWEPFDNNLKEVSEISITDVMQKINEIALPHFLGENTTCTKCKTGHLQIKTSKFGAFIGCSNYPECTYTHQLESFDEETSANSDLDNKVLGTDDGVEITLKKGPYGFYIEKAEKKPKRIAIPKTIKPEELTIDKAIFLSRLPLKLDDNLVFSIGPYGPYLKHDKDFVSYKGDIFEITKEVAQSLVGEATKKKNGINLGNHPQTKEPIVVKFGRYGAYICYNKSNIKIPKEFKNKDLSLEDSIEIINKA